MFFAFFLCDKVFHTLVENFCCKAVENFIEWTFGYKNTCFGTFFWFSVPLEEFREGKRLFSLDNRAEI